MNTDGLMKENNSWIVSISKWPYHSWLTICKMKTMPNGAKSFLVSCNLSFFGFDYYADFCCKLPRESRKQTLLPTQQPPNSKRACRKFPVSLTQPQKYSCLAPCPSLIPSASCSGPVSRRLSQTRYPAVPFFSDHGARAATVAPQTRSLPGAPCFGTSTPSSLLNIRCSMAPRKGLPQTPPLSKRTRLAELRMRIPACVGGCVGSMTRRGSRAPALQRLAGWNRQRPAGTSGEQSGVCV